ncbi:5617_t:CDS:2 [Scutellospora calospora]|uniref:5617_t:CDS:1 n=1 Tax=Scutellospora calospora TaxID=85575 RepID=A0ACA9M1I4_9GLOM|nr:5617_t:CDS:2 [Scutellospora calospora]
MLSVDNEKLPSEEESLQAAIQRNLETQLPPQALYNTQPHYKIEVSKTGFKFDNKAEFD